MLRMLLDATAAANTEEVNTSNIVAGATLQPMQTEWQLFLDYLKPIAGDESFFHEHVPLLRTPLHCE